MSCIPSRIMVVLVQTIWIMSQQNMGPKSVPFSTLNSPQRVRYPRSESLRSGFEIFERQKSEILNQDASTSPHGPSIWPFYALQSFYLHRQICWNNENWHRSTTILSYLNMCSQNKPASQWHHPTSPKSRASLITPLIYHSCNVLWTSSHFSVFWILCFCHEHVTFFSARYLSQTSFWKNTRQSHTLVPIVPYEYALPNI